jgi:hypothetical protein
MKLPSNEHVVLLHGLAESPLTMAKLEVSLRAMRYGVTEPPRICRRP